MNDEGHSGWKVASVGSPRADSGISPSARAANARLSSREL